MENFLNVSKEFLSVLDDFLKTDPRREMKIEDNFICFKFCHYYGLTDIIEEGCKFIKSYKQLYRDSLEDRVIKEFIASFNLILKENEYFNYELRETAEKSDYGQCATKQYVDSEKFFEERFHVIKHYIDCELRHFKELFSNHDGLYVKMLSREQNGFSNFAFRLTAFVRVSLAQYQFYEPSMHYLGRFDQNSIITIDSTENRNKIDSKIENFIHNINKLIMRYKPEYIFVYDRSSRAVSAQACELEGASVHVPVTKTKNV